MPIPPPDANSVDSYDLWFQTNYIIFQGIRYGYPLFDENRLALQELDKDVGRLLHRKEEDLGIWHCNDAWKNYLGFDLHICVENLYRSFHKMRMTKGYDVNILSAMLVVGVCIITGNKLREDVCVSPTIWAVRPFDCI